MAEWHLLVVLNWKLARAPDISPRLLKVKSMRSSDHGDLSGNKFLTKGSCQSILLIGQIPMAIGSGLYSQ